jgi:hypothetical protein
MRSTLTAQQIAFFSKNGSIEFEVPGSTFQHLPTKLSFSEGRDLFRGNEALKTFLVRKVGPLALELTGKKRLRLASDQWIPAGHLWHSNAPLKDLFSVQGLLLGALVCRDEVSVEKRSALGLLPLPSKPGHILFFKPHIILNWKELLRLSPTDQYLVAFSQEDAIYIENQKDPSTNSLKKLGLGFGDKLGNSTHPLILG